MFATMFNFQCSVDPSTGFFPASPHRKIFFAVVKLKKASFFRTTTKKQNSQTALDAFGIVTSLLANRTKSLKFYRFEPVQHLVSFL